MKRYTFRIGVICMFVVLIAGGIWLVNRSGNRVGHFAEKSYVFRTFLVDDDIKIDITNDSVATLTGTVSTWSKRSLAKETVSGLSGVKMVVNNLEVKDGLPADGSDLWIRDKVKTMLMFNRNFDGFKTDVDVKDGVVTLSGEAKSEAQIESMTAYVLDIGGVINITNDITVEKEVKAVSGKGSDYVDDASITAQVRLAMLFNRMTSNFKTEVETKNGLVTLSGNALNSIEKEFAGELAGYIHGVRGVRNDIVIR